jgi:phosphoribosylformimino-5-aminoimidazole carboxamide ribotide isomerase
VMTLERVGADAGPDLDTLREVQARSPSTALVGAGGIRDAADLDRAAAAGAWAWLVASALHDGRLPKVAR